MKTSQQWWQETKSDPASLHAWLAAQYHGELTAAERIEQFLIKQATFSKDVGLLQLIAEQERKHANWVGDLMKRRGLEPKRLDKEERYWDQTLPSITSFEKAAAVAAFAEEMRLERIKVISEDYECDPDIREVFAAILQEELFHAKAFNYLSRGAKDEVAEGHARGLEALGLII